MSSVGSYLRDLRTRRGVSLEEISRSTRVLTLYLEALEADELGALPAPVFTKGFVRAYCQALGVAPEEALALYEGRVAEETDTRPGGAQARPGQASGGTEAGRRREAADSRSRGAVLAGFVMLVVLGVALFGVTLWLQPGREPRREEQTAVHVPQPKPAPDVAAPPVGALPGPAPAVAAPAPAASPASAAPPPRIGGVTSPYRLVARTSERTWIRVRTEDGRTSEENVPAGETREWVSNRPFILSIGNAGGVALELNGRPVPQLGPSGAVIERLVLPSDVP